MPTRERNIIAGILFESAKFDYFAQPAEPAAISIGDFLPCSNLSPLPQKQKEPPVHDGSSRSRLGAMESNHYIQIQSLLSCH